ncbi:MAG: rod shape-determining protein MreC [Syntrophobacteraceae bacterium]|jgi:rod shape-determining protein MreC|nr:rod shape-determining protein MreC [Syntrophobacteraceae bacterium]
MMGWLRRLKGAFFIALFLAAFFYVSSLNFRPPERMDLLQRFVMETVGPVVKSFGNISGLIESTVGEYIWLRRVREENEGLRERVAGLERKLIEYQEAYIENLRLRRLLDFRSTIQGEAAAAQVVVHDMTGWFQTLIVDKGFRDDIAPDMPVVNDEGVIGRILDVSDHYARVLMITDPGSAVDAIVQRNRVRGILGGKDANGCLLKYVRGNLDVQVGDLIITSGKDGLFPKGLRLGVVQGIFKDPVDLFQKIEVKPLVRLSALEELLIIKKGTVIPDVAMGN